jgi:hypothetical protein
LTRDRRHAGGGAPYHIDYFRTSFWNKCLAGAKYWVLIPPETARRMERE